ncbi:MAG: 7-cyano-7-deazaguanine synthase [Nitrospirales bacterium]|nr:MAG: 7-cyano-7-deazaguanine synthase [Nitrospirales bacterium]
MSTRNAIILASGGLDSTVTATIAKSEGYNLHLLTVLYGQRHRIEVTRAASIATWLQAKEHKVIELDLRVFGGSALTEDLEVPKQQSLNDRQAGIPITYVPARNTIFLSLALAYAEVIHATRIYFGANVRDYSGYPDCRPEFVQAFVEVARLGTQRGVEGESIDILTPLMMMTKAEIIQKGLELDAPLHLTHSCYAPQADGRACGECDSCLFRQEGFQAVGMDDPSV